MNLCALRIQLCSQLQNVGNTGYGLQPQQQTDLKQVRLADKLHCLFHKKLFVFESVLVKHIRTYMYVLRKVKIPLRDKGLTRHNKRVKFPNLVTSCVYLMFGVGIVK